MKDEDYNIREEDNWLSSASANDCTGLIPAGEGDERQLDRYRELYPFGQPVPPKEKERRRPH